MTRAIAAMTDAELGAAIAAVERVPHWLREIEERTFLRRLYAERVARAVAVPPRATDYSGRPIPRCACGLTVYADGRCYTCYGSRATP